MTGAMRAVLLASLLAMFFPVVAVAQDANALFEEGIDLWERNRNSEAIAKFKEVLSLNPSSEGVMLAVETAGVWPPAGGPGSVISALARPPAGTVTCTSW